RRRDGTSEHGHAVLLEDATSLVLVEVHADKSFRWLSLTMFRHRDIRRKAYSAMARALLSARRCDRRSGIRTPHRREVGAGRRDQASPGRSTGRSAAPS